jgi:hypothetical protein
MVYEEDRHQMLLFGGYGYAPDGTWLLNLNFGQPGEPFAFVDWTNTGSQDGSLDHPFATIQQAISWSGYGPGTTISIHAGDYNEGPLTFCMPGSIVATGGLVRIR